MHIRLHSSVVVYCCIFDCLRCPYTVAYLFYSLYIVCLCQFCCSSSDSSVTCLLKFALVCSVFVLVCITSMQDISRNRSACYLLVKTKIIATTATTIDSAGSRTTVLLVKTNILIIFIYTKSRITAVNRPPLDQITRNYTGYGPFVETHWLKNIFLKFVLSS